LTQPLMCHAADSHGEGTRSRRANGRRKMLADRRECLTGDIGARMMPEARARLWGRVIPWGKGWWCETYDIGARAVAHGRAADL
jgi:hypothetical protein